MPLLDRVLVQRIKAEAKTASGIFLPESSVKELNEAKVLAVGPGGLDKEGKRVPMGVQAGDRVLIPTVSPDFTRRFHVGQTGVARCRGKSSGSRVADIVSYAQFGGSPVKVGEDEYHLFRDSE